MSRNIIAPLIIGPLFAIAGYFVAFHFGKPILDKANASKDWPSVTGVITESNVSTRRSDGSTMYSANITYKYEVDGNPFQAGTVYFGDGGSSSSSSGAYAITRRYPKGKQVEIFYQADAPENAALEPGVKWSSYLVYGIGLLFLVVGVLVLLTPLGYLLIGTFAIAGLIGKRPRDETQSWRSASPSQSVDTPIRTSDDDEDDGFNMS